MHIRIFAVRGNRAIRLRRTVGGNGRACYAHVSKFWRMWNDALEIV